MSAGIELLEHHEKRILEALAKLDIEKFAKDLQSYQVVTLQARKIISSLDCKRLASQTIARYLLNHVYVRISEDSANCVKFLTVLAGVDNEWVARMGRALLQVFPNDPAATGTERDSDKNELVEQDVNYLRDSLAGVSYKWEEIGISLKLPQDCIDKCRNASTNILRLHNVLNEWVSGRHLLAKPATLFHLRETLSSKTVQQPRLAGDIKRKMKEAVSSSTSLSVMNSHSESSLEILFESTDIKVRDGKSALLEVLVRPKGSVSYQWIRDGLPLYESSTFTDTRTSMLLINQVSQGIEGKYCCQISHGTRTLTSSSIEVTIKFKQGKKLLLDIYVSQHEIPQDSWPLINPNTYIDLSLVKANKVTTKDLNWFVERDIEDILLTREKIGYREAFGYEKGALVLVEGRPGSGKTTLAQKIAKDWAKGKILHEAQMIFLIPLHEDKNESEIFKTFFRRQFRKEQERLEKSSGDKACFILDGYDQYNSRHGCNSAINQLLSKAYLPHAMIIVTSRPVATVTLRHQATRRVEILGFTKKQFEVFVDSFPFETLVSSKDAHQAKSKLKTYLTACTNVLSMCYLPINACIICFLYSQKLGLDTPKTETAIYEQLVIAIALRKKRIRNPSAQLSSLKDFHGEDKESLLSLCSLAFKMITENKQVINDLPMSLDSLNKSPLRGLLTIDMISRLFGLESVLTFLHLTLQEYLAAYYLSGLHEDQQMEMVKLHSAKDHMLTTFKFYCGLIDMPRNIPQFVLISEVRLDTLHIFHCAFETQEKAVCSRAVELTHGEIVLSPGVLTPADFTVLGYVMSAASLQVTGMFIPPCLLYEEYVNDNEWKNRKLDKTDSLSFSFVNTASGSMSLMRLCTKDLFRTRISYNCKSSHFQARQKFKELLGIQDRHNTYGYDKLNDDSSMISSDLFGSDSARPLANALKHCNKLKRLRLFGNYKSKKTSHIIVSFLENCTDLEEVGIFCPMPLSSTLALSAGIQCCQQLQKLLLYHLDLCSEGAAVLAKSLIYCVNLEILHVPNCNIGPEGTEALMSGLQHIFLKNFNITYNNIGDKGMLALANDIRFSRLIASTNNIGSSGVKALAKSLLKNPVLITLHLPKNDLCSSDMKVLAEGLCCCTNLQDLKLCDNDMGPDGGATLADRLRSCTSLEYLQLQNCNICADGLMTLARGFICWKNLKLLSLSNNGIISTGVAVTIADGLQFLTSLEELHLSNNGINSDSATALARGLSHCYFLHTLDISKNAIGSTGAIALTTGLKCACMKFLNISHTNIDVESVQELCNFVQSSSVQKLDLSQNDIGSTGALCFITEMVSNRLPIKINLLENNISRKATEFLVKKLHRNTHVLVLFSNNKS